MGMLRAVGLAFMATWGFAATAAPADADGPPHRYPTYDATPGFYDFKWTGFFFGAHLGGGHTGHDVAETVVLSADPLILDTATHGPSASSVLGGVQAGWQKQWEKFVAGIELTYTAVQFDETSHSLLLPDAALSGEVRDLITLTGRLGFADGRWLAYAKGGWASADIDITYRNTVTGAVASSGGRESGWTAGVGIDYALSLNLFLGIEYNYLHFSADVPRPLTLQPVVDVRTGDADVDIQTLVVRLNYRFGGPAR